MAAAEQQTITSIFDVLDYIEHMSKSAKEKGDLWERVTAWYLRNDPQSQQVVGRVWRWSDSDNPLYDGQDTGIDIVCEDRDSKGRYWAVQCKNFNPTHKLTYEDLSTFFAKVEAKPAYCGYIVASASDALSGNLTDHALHVRQDMGITTEFLTPTGMAGSNVDWSQCLTNSLSHRVTFDSRPHQVRAIRQINSSLETHDRCKAIMACGTGKTLMSLRLAEDRCPHGLVLFGAPSIALVSQAMREWTNQARESLRTLVVCSDAKASKVKADAVLDDIIDLSYPASTDPSSLVARYRQIREDNPRGMVAIFSTYQSMQVIQDAQRTGLPTFDFAICDEAHRTTGVRTPDMTDEEVSAFQIVNDGTRIRAAKRVYMTATPRIYGDKVKQKAKETASTLCSMDDEEIYGPVAYSLPFAEAVEKQLLCDYRVVVLAVKEEDVPENIQHLISDGSELQVDDAAKIIGTYKGLANHGVAAQERLNLTEGSEADITPDFLLIDDLLDIEEPDDSLNEGVKPLHRAVGFCSRISDSKRIDTYFKQVVERYIEETRDDQGLTCKLDHVDGSMDSKERASKLEWLASNDSSEECRILTNARCLAEGVDVPSLDAVIFFAPRKSEVDVVQAVGRVMRTFKNKVTGEEKELGYIILPIVIPAGMTPEQSLNNSRTFDVVWKVLQALRSHDERMDAYVNSIPFRMTRKGSGAGVNGRNTIGRPARDDDQPTQGTLDLDFGSTDLERAVYAKMVDRCGTKIYWDAWADDVAHIAEHYVAQIEDALERNANTREGFDKFLHSLRASLNPGIKPDDAVQMVAQHMITLPIFDALFGDYKFAGSNPVSVAITDFLATLEGEGVGEMGRDDRRELDDLYDSVRRRARVARTDANRQELIKDLYNDFFSKAFKATSEKLGIVYTPVEIVDYMLHAADRTMRREFGRGISDVGVHVLDPFAGTGSYMAELISDPKLIPAGRLKDKYTHELHSNEILLLAYYIMVVNVEYAYHERMGGSYEPFPGSVLTDTFQMSEGDDELDLGMFVENSERVLTQQDQDIFLVIGNPPYSAGQSNANDDNANEHYPMLEQRIRETYASQSEANLKNSLYDSYIEAFRWASDRIGEEGIVCYVSNAGWLRSDAGAGVRRCFAKEFSSIYVFDLLGNQRTQGEESRRQGGKVFGSGSRAPIAITMLVKNPASSEHGAVHYFSVGEYKSQQQKLQTVANYIDKEPAWETLTMDRHGDWLDKRDDNFYEMAPMGVWDGSKKTCKGLFATWSRGLTTSRDSWMIGFSKQQVILNMNRMIANYNHQVREYLIAKDKFVINRSKKYISWTDGLESMLSKRNEIRPSSETRTIQYRPFVKEQIYVADYPLVHRPYLQPHFFPLVAPHETAQNIVIALTTGNNASCLISNQLPDLHFVGDAQCFPLYWYEKDEGEKLLPAGGEKVVRDAWGGRYVRHDGITDQTLDVFRSAFPLAFAKRTKKEGGSEISKEDVFYYIYGVLHAPDYRKRFAANLAKELPRIPLAREFEAFSRAGRALANLHLNYEKVDMWPNLVVEGVLPGMDPGRVEKLAWGKKKDPETGKRVNDYTRLIYNRDITVSNIPESANDYKVNGRSPLEWMVDRYQVKTDKATGITNDPNDYSDDPRYILDLIGRLVTVSMRTNEIVAGLSPIDEVKHPSNWPDAWKADIA